MIIKAESYSELAQACTVFGKARSGVTTDPPKKYARAYVRKTRPTTDCHSERKFGGVTWKLYRDPSDGASWWAEYQAGENSFTKLLPLTSEEKAKLEKYTRLGSQYTGPVPFQLSSRPPFSLIPIEGLIAEARRHELGRAKHEPDQVNDPLATPRWKKETSGRYSVERIISHLLGHTYELMSGIYNEEDKHPLDHIGAIRWAGGVLAWIATHQPERFLRLEGRKPPIKHESRHADNDE